MNVGLFFLIIKCHSGFLISKIVLWRFSSNKNNGRRRQLFQKFLHTTVLVLNLKILMVKKRQKSIYSTKINQNYLNTVHKNQFLQDLECPSPPPGPGSWEGGQGGGGRFWWGLITFDELILIYPLDSSVIAHIETRNYIICWKLSIIIKYELKLNKNSAKICQCPKYLPLIYVTTVFA